MAAQLEHALCQAEEHLLRAEAEMAQAAENRRGRKDRRRSAAVPACRSRLDPPISWVISPGLPARPSLPTAADPRMPMPGRWATRVLSEAAPPWSMTDRAAPPRFGGRAGGPGGPRSSVILGRAAARPSRSTMRLVHRLIFIRHGETDWNLEGRLQGQHDVALNARGRDQAAAAAVRSAKSSEPMRAPRSSMSPRRSGGRGGRWNSSAPRSACRRTPMRRMRG